MIISVVLFNVLGYFQINETDITFYEWLGLRKYRLIDAIILPFILLVILFVGPILYGIYYLMKAKNEYDPYIILIQ